MNAIPIAPIAIVSHVGMGFGYATRKGMIDRGERVMCSFVPVGTGDPFGPDPSPEGLGYFLPSLPGLGPEKGFVPSPERLGYFLPSLPGLKPKKGFVPSIEWLQFVLTSLTGQDQIVGCGVSDSWYLLKYRRYR